MVNSNLVTPNLTSVTTNAPNFSDNLQYRWLKGVPCFLPCWEGIVIGRTKAPEAVELLKKNPLIGEVRNISGLNSSSNKNDQGVIVWDIPNQPSTIKPYGNGGTIIYNISDQVIISIAPSFRDFYKLSDIQKAYGEPSNIIATVGLGENGYSYAVRLLYLSKGLTLELHNDNRNTKPILNPESTLKFPQFYDPNLEGYKKVFTFNSKTFLDWEGFKPFEYYCRELYTGSKDNCN
jgi:hypothetical protein